MIEEKYRPISNFIPSTSELGLELHVAELGKGSPILFIHGATVASHGFYAPVKGRNWMAAAAEAGFASYALDIRGYGKSQSDQMWKQTNPYAPASDAIKDIDDAVEWISRRHRCAPSLVGISWGSVTCGLYASTIGRERINRLVLAAPIFAERNELWRNMIGDPADKEKLNPAFGAYRATALTDLLDRVNEELPVGCDWHSEGAVEAVVTSALQDDVKSNNFAVPKLHSPNGTFVDLIQCFNGVPLYRPEDVNVPVMIIRGSHDLTSTRSDALNLFDKIGSSERRYIEIANGGHFVSLAKNSGEVFSETNNFLTP